MKLTIKQAITTAITLFTALVILSYLFFRFGADVEAVVLEPLFTDVKGTVITANESEAEILLVGTKSRNCQLLAANAFIDVGGVTVRGEVKMLKRDKTELAIPDQRIAVNSNFVRFVRVRPAGPVKITLESRCHPLWVSYQHLDVIQINSGVAQR